MTEIFPDHTSRYQAYQQIFQLHPVGKKVWADMMIRVLPAYRINERLAANHGVLGLVAGLIEAREALLSQLIEPRAEVEVVEKEEFIDE